MSLKASNNYIFSAKSRMLLKHWLHKIGCTYSQVKHITTSTILNLNESVHKHIPPEYFDKKLVSRLDRSGYVYLNDPVIAKSIAAHLCNDWTDGYIFESNPGPAILTKAILNAGAPHLRVFERNAEFLSVLKDLSNTYSNLEIVQEDILCLPTFEARKWESNVNEVIFSGIPKYPWGEGVPFRFFSIISSKQSIKMLRFLLSILPKRTSIFSFGGCELFLLLKESEYKYMIAQPRKSMITYRWTTFLYNLCFEINLLDKFTSQIFFPTPSHCRKKTASNNFYFVKLCPRPQLFSSLVNGNQLSELHFFIRHNLVKRTKEVIPTLENWIPNCGPRLIKEGMNVFTKFGDLSPLQLLLLFNQFSSWPEYEHSIFHAALKRYHAKMCVANDDDDTS